MPSDKHGIPCVSGVTISAPGGLEQLFLQLGVLPALHQLSCVFLVLILAPEGPGFRALLGTVIRSLLLEEALWKLPLASSFLWNQSLKE